MILVTGASGFVGDALCGKLSTFAPLRASVRNKHSFNFSENIEISQASLSMDQDWTSVLSGISVVIHCASRVHVMNECAIDPLFEFRQVNVLGTLNLARQASKAGVERFIFISSIKVNGESTDLGHPFSADQLPLPIDPYGVSKYEAELALMDLANESGMEVVIIRSPLVYGPGVKANFLSMMKWVLSNLPLPFGGITQNRRSFIFLENLTDIITICIRHPAAANQIFLVSDDDDLSTTELLRRMAFALGRPSRLFQVPSSLIRLLARLTGMREVNLRLFSSLQVDIKKTKDLLGWTPPVSVDEGFRQTALYLLKKQS